MLILSAINPEQALSDDEAELMELDLAAVAAGSTEALERLYNTAKAAVYSYSLSVLRNVQDAEDVLHDCFVNIFTAAAGYTPARQTHGMDNHHCEEPLLCKAAAAQSTGTASR